MHKFQEEDQALFEAIEAYRNGHQEKATVIYEKTKKYTFNILHKEVERFKSQSILTGDAIPITEDVMQDLYIDFFKNIAKFRNEDPRSIYKWISIVSHRMVLAYVDKNKMEVLQFEKDEDYREENDIWDSAEINDSDMESDHEMLPEAALEDKEFRQIIMDFIQSLPEAQAQTILLHFRGGMKYQEIADEMGVSLITVKTRMKKAKDSFEEIINNYEKKTGTKLHSVSILPLLWLLYRMSSESTTVPVAVDTAVTGSLAGASGVGIGGAGATVATKAISTRVLIAIVSTVVVIGGVAVGSQFIGQKQETVIEKEQEDLQDDSLEVDSEEIEQEEKVPLEDNEKKNELSEQVNKTEPSTQEKQSENNDSLIAEPEIVVTQEEIETIRTINVAYRDFLVEASGNFYGFNVIDVNTDGIPELLLDFDGPSQPIGPCDMYTYKEEEGDVKYAGKGAGALCNMEYCDETGYILAKIPSDVINGVQMYDARVYDYNTGWLNPALSFFVGSDGKYYEWIDGDYVSLSVEKTAEIDVQLQEYFPYKVRATAPYQADEATLARLLPIDDEGIKQQLKKEYE